MTSKYILIFILLFSLSVNAQIDSKQKSVAIPAVESKKDSATTNVFSSTNPKSNPQFRLNTPKVSPNLELPKKEFSMFPEEEFGNPGELYSDNLKRLNKEVLPEGHGEFSGLKEDAYWGDYKTKSEYVQVLYRDYGRVDGDVLRILVNDDIIKSAAYLGDGYSGFKLKLIDGFNKIDFYAVNEGEFKPNTAAYKILDQWGTIISKKVWALAQGVKVTIIVVKE
ncbi:hypothetical protein PK35_07725 [Tamlana nanhaiensis]|uniref:Secreted protein n=1 Tax=Neotamlana nanhaiensis TaxID=1382798 RepID=A0A0D7W1E7_9FLAO|nr:hypothetical protein [Tamlana nanhaiensis]KJD32859.1 hypothetical protein PK35_07725 [Tamlana nanhaiensis]